jgi:hypothetical protein
MRKHLFLLQFFLLFLNSNTWGQVKPSEGGVFSQMYSKEITEYRAKEYIVNEILNVPNRKAIDVEISALTASKSGELTSVVYNCPQLKKGGLLFCFYNERINEFSLRYNGYAFSYYEFEKAKELFYIIDSLFYQKEGFLVNNDYNTIYKWDDVTLVLYQLAGSKMIRVLWNGFDSEWNQANMNTTKKRCEKFFKKTK